MANIRVTPETLNAQGNELIGYAKKDMLSLLSISFFILPAAKATTSNANGKGDWQGRI